MAQHAQFQTPQAPDRHRSLQCPVKHLLATAFSPQTTRFSENNKEQFDFDWLKEAVKEKSLITVNGVSGGKTSAYIAKNYPADHNVFALVRTDDKNCLFPDAKIRQIVSDRIGTEFIGTLEENAIIYTMLDLEQFIGQKIDWVTGKTFDEIIDGP